MMFAHLREALGSGRPVEFVSTWPLEESIARMRALVKGQFPDSPSIAGSTSSTEVTIRTAWKFLVNLRNTQFSGGFVTRGESVLLVGTFNLPAWRKFQYAPTVLLGASWIVGAAAYICEVAFVEPETFHARPLQPLAAAGGILFFAYVLSLLRLDEDGMRVISAGIKKALGPNVT